MRHSPVCNQCQTSLALARAFRRFYAWRCPARCSPDLSTGVSTRKSLTPFERLAIRGNHLEFSIVAGPLTPDLVPGAPVYMPSILAHFIECTWGGCYNSIYQSCIKPHLDCPEVLDFVLRSPVILDKPNVIRAKTGARIFGDLLYLLKGVESASIREYLNNTFDGAH